MARIVKRFVLPMVYPLVPIIYVLRSLSLPQPQSVFFPALCLYLTHLYQNTRCSLFNPVGDILGFLLMGYASSTNAGYPISTPLENNTDET